MSWLTLVSRSFLAWSSRVCWSTRSSAVETSRPTLRRASSRPSDGAILLLGEEVHRAEDPAADEDREAEAGLQAAPAGHRGSRAGLHLAQVGDEDQVAGLPGLPLSPSPSRNRASVLTRRNSSLTEPESWTNRRACSSGVDLPERPVRPAERLADAGQGRGDDVADRVAPAQRQEQLVDRADVGRGLGLASAPSRPSRSPPPR